MGGGRSVGEGWGTWGMGGLGAGGTGGGVRWVGYMGGTWGWGYWWGSALGGVHGSYVCGVEVRGRGNFFAIFFKKSEIGCVQEKLRRAARTKK